MILSDVYNSNPTAAKEVLQAFAEVKVAGKRIAVLGDMLEWIAVDLVHIKLSL